VAVVMSCDLSWHDKPVRLRAPVRWAVGPDRAPGQQTVRYPRVKAVHGGAAKCRKAGLNCGRTSRSSRGARSGSA